MIELSILVCSVHTRYDTFLPKIEKQLFEQYASLSDDDQERVELLVLTDNKKIVLGDKRSTMVEMAHGRYVVFIDDDDRIADDYILELLDATASDADSIVFQAEVTLNGGSARPCYYSKDIKADYNTTTAYYRIPNHVCCIKRSIALDAKFPSITYGEDAGYSKKLLPHLLTEHVIDKVLYYYDYDSETTETRPYCSSKPNTQPVKPIVDVIILSKSSDRRSQFVTQQAIDTCFNGANGLPINIIVIESASGQYRNATTILKHESFNYNGFANAGAELGDAEWIMIANNDLRFHDGWLQHLLEASNDLVSPHEPNDLRQKGIIGNQLGDTCGRHLSGWCFMIKRKLWEDIGKFDTCVSFWCSDDVVLEQVLAKGIQPMLVKNSIVEHRYSSTINSMNKADQDNLKWGNLYIFNKKYSKTKFIDHPGYIRWLKDNKNE